MDPYTEGWPRNTGDFYEWGGVDVVLSDAERLADEAAAEVGARQDEVDYLKSDAERLAGGTGRGSR